MKRVLKPGVHILAIPTEKELLIEELFPKEISGSTIEKLDPKGQWKHKETILFENNAFTVSADYKIFSAFQIIRLVLKRSIAIDWDVKFVSHSGLENSSLIYEEGFDFEEALQLAQLSELVYSDEEKIKDTLTKSYDFDTFFYYSKQSHKKMLQKGWAKLFMVFFKSKTPLIDLQFMHLSKVDKKTGKNLIVVVFRGSQEPQDWMTNFNLNEDKFEGKGRVHKGFHQAMKLFFKTIKEKDLTDTNLPPTILENIKNINNNSQIILIGHSLGGALATIAGCYLYEKGVQKENLEVYTFGAPPVGTKDFTQYYDNKINLYRLINSDDVVPKLDKITNLFHLGREIVLPSNDGEVHACKGYIDNIIDSIEMSFREDNDK